MAHGTRSSVYRIPHHALCVCASCGALKLVKVSFLEKVTFSSSLGMLVAVHVGAGSHSAGKEELYKAAMRNACNAAVQRLSGVEGTHPLDAVKEAISVLEVKCSPQWLAHAQLSPLPLLERLSQQGQGVFHVFCVLHVRRMMPAPMQGMDPV